MIIRWQRWRLIFALLVLVLGLVTLERARLGVEISTLKVGQTPVTVMRGAKAGPAVVIAHGFAGSRQMMQGYGLLLAQAGYVVYAFDFEGHGRNPVPMSGDVSAIDGTTQLLVAQTDRVIDAAIARGNGSPVALLGHSMATDILIRASLARQGSGPLVLISAFSAAITETEPNDMLFITGAWELALADFALESADTAAPEVKRAAVIAPLADHVSILQSRAGRQAALDWLNEFYDREGEAAVLQTGWALMGVLAAITLLFPVVARCVPRSTHAPQVLSPSQFALVVGVPVLLVPPIATLIDLKALPVLVADYLAVHLALYGTLQLALLVWLGHRFGVFGVRGAALLLIWTLVVFGAVLNRYGANFWPIPERLSVIAALALGAVPFMLADAAQSYGAPVWQRVMARLGVLASFGFAVLLDFEGLFFLMMIAPVIVLFYLSFGYMGRVGAKRFGPLGTGLALGLALAWALGVSFPLFAV